MSNISSNTLFHFTKSYDNLLGILTNDFYPRFSLEDHSNTKLFEEKVAFPMVCFCDIPLSQLSSTHVKSYGKYGIGLTKEWGIQNKLNPVLYLESNTYLSKVLDNFYSSFWGLDFDLMTKQIEDIKNELINKNTTIPTLEDILAVLLEHNDIDSLKIYLLFNYLSFVRFIKPYKGNYPKDNTVYYNEREWRYVPELKPDIRSNALLVEEFSNIEINNKYNFILERDKLVFSPNDIKYIILRDDSEILQMVEDIKYLKYKYPEDVVTKLTTKIISWETVEKDL